MAENKTKETESRVESHLGAIKDKARHKDCDDLAKLMARATKQPAKMWGGSIVGFGSFLCQCESGREGNICLVGFSTCKSEISRSL